MKMINNFEVLYNVISHLGTINMLKHIAFCYIVFYTLQYV